jgi:DNA polymerase I-like protein with 3'-5' exonuclease and polymerase domains
MEKPEVEIHILETWDDVIAMMEYVDSEDFPIMSLDIETDSASEKKATIYGVGLSFQPTQAFYIPIKRPDGSLVVASAEQSILANWIKKRAEAKGMIGHNVLYDVLVIERNWGVDLSPDIKADTILMKHCIDEERPHGLKETSVKYLGAWADQAQDELKNNVLERGGRWNNENKDMFLADTAILGKYCAFDTILSHLLFNLFDRKIDEQQLRGLFEEEVMPLYREVTIDMKRKGFHVDVAHFQKLESELKERIAVVESEIQEEIADSVQEFCVKALEEDFPIKNSGNFPKALAKTLDLPLPTNAKTGKVTLSEKAVRAQLEKTPEGEKFYKWVLGEETIENVATPEQLNEARIALYFEKNEDSNYIFNLSSNHHLAWLFFSKMGFTPIDTTEGGAPTVDDDFVESIRGEAAFVDKLLDYKKLNKLLSTYVQGILERQIDGVIYASMLQFGTTSGRFSSTSPNIQNLPRIKDEESNLTELVLHYTNEIKRGFIAPKGYVLVNADYSALEPRAFAHTSGDYLLQQVFHDNLDLYSQVAIQTFGLEGVSADKKAENYLGNISKEKRQIAKTITLAVTYGAEAGRIADLLKIDYKEAAGIISNYLDAFPGLGEYIKRQRLLAKTRGMVKSQFGRIRHLPECLGIYKKFGDRISDYKWANANGVTQERRKFKNCLNNSTNFPIQALAAHIVNRAMIAVNREFKRNNVDAYIIAQVHDEVTCVARKEHAEKAKEIVKRCMEDTTKLSVPLVAEPVVADNWADAK